MASTPLPCLLEPHPSQATNLEGVDLLRIADESFEEAKRRAGEWIACAPGCDECCRKPFAITEDDAIRLREGVAALGVDDIAQRANAAWERLKSDFPGDVETGILDANDEWREWFFTRHKGLPCPVLDEASGQCRLYAYRPICCRIYGPLIEISGQVSDPCHLCYRGSTPEEIESTRIRVNLPDPPNAVRETVIAFALSSQR